MCLEGCNCEHLFPVGDRQREYVYMDGQTLPRVGSEVVHWIKVSDAIYYISIGMATPTWACFFTIPCYCGIVKACSVVPILNEESEVKCFAQVRGVGRQLIWDNQLDLLTPDPGSLSCPGMPFINAEAWKHLDYLDPVKYPGNRYQPLL